jgi:hypothetical protein
MICGNTRLPERRVVQVVCVTNDLWDAEKERCKREKAVEEIVMEVINVGNSAGT